MAKSPKTPKEEVQDPVEGAVIPDKTASEDVPQDGQPDNGPTHHHDEDSCLLCQHLAKAQAELPSLSANEVADPIVESQVVESDVIPVRQAAAHDCRGPPIV